MFSLSLRERLLVAAVLSAVLVGAAVKHWRDTRRESPALLPPAAAQAASLQTQVQNDTATTDTPHYSLVRPAQGRPQP